MVIGVTIWVLLVHEILQEALVTMLVFFAPSMTFGVKQEGCLG